MDVQSEAYAARVAQKWATADRTIRSFWQNPVIMAEIRRRITGDSKMSPELYFKRQYCPAPLRTAISLGSGDGQLECSLVDVGVCENILGIDISPERVQRAQSRVPQRLRGRVNFLCANLETWRPDSGRVDLVVVKSILHHIQDLEGWCQLFLDILDPRGFVYVDDFIGPTRFQWTEQQLSIINALLTALPSDLKIDLTSATRQLKERVGRPNLSRFIAADPSEAIRSSEIVAVLDQHLHCREFKPYGGAIFHMLFSRIMGNFQDRDDIVRLILAFEAILMDAGVIGSDYLWAVYQLKAGLSKP
jgi:SAM-dependent methyltransferase